MKLSGKRGSELFLMELILAILFFSIASAVCVRLYADARLISETTKAENIGVSRLDSFASVLCTDPADPASAVERLAPEAALDEASALIGYDASWNACSPDTAAYTIKINWSIHNNMMTAELSLCRASDNTQLHSLLVEKHIPLVSSQLTGAITSSGKEQTGAIYEA